MVIVHDIKFCQELTHEKHNVVNERTASGRDLLCKALVLFRSVRTVNVEAAKKKNERQTPVRLASPYSTTSTQQQLVKCKRGWLPRITAVSREK